MAGTTQYFKLPTVSNSDDIDGAAQITALANASETAFRAFATTGDAMAVTYTDSTKLTALFGASSNFMLCYGGAGTGLTSEALFRSGSSNNRLMLDTTGGGIRLYPGETYAVWASVCISFTTSQTIAVGIGQTNSTSSNIPNHVYGETLLERAEAGYQTISSFWLVDCRNQAEWTRVAPFMRSSKAPNLVQSASIMAMQLTGGDLLRNTAV